MIKLVDKYLDLNNFLNAKKEFEDLFLSHPNYPSLFAITDSLNILSIDNIVIKVPKEQLHELPNSFLAIFNNDLVLVDKTESSVVIETEKGKKTKLTIADFSEGWNGVVLAIEANEVQEEKVMNEGPKWLKYGILFLVLIVLSSFYNEYSVYDYGFLITSLLGLLISVFIVQEKFGIDNQIVSKLCNINPTTSCDSVIKSENEKSNNWFSFSDLPLLFFMTSVLAMLIGSTNSSLVGFLSLMAVPVIVYSIWVQKFQIKKWCVLCLSVSVLMIIQGVIWVFESGFRLNLTLTNLFQYLFSLILVSSLWSVMKPVIEAGLKAAGSVKDLTKFRRNFTLFEFLSKEIVASDGFDELEGIHFGNSTATAKISIILSPSCGHCHKAFEDAFELVWKFPEKISLNVLFNINPDNNQNPYKVVVERLLMINDVNPENIVEAISDWHIKKMGLELWQKKWNVDSVSMRVNQQIQKQYDWCSKNEFNYTPVKILNTRLYPSEYELSELKYFINDVLEDNEAVERDSLVYM
ncbi:vitamin K epoxide reductase family protein [Flavobacterium branchiarum]|uniref:Vitamin K epoxide reductase family protein n=1 Tax=Flavobacterium branchiarum TaxID=1114870 RepID=A0ABV5FJ72_9FLAO|nr:vitamin K epoxide reductase family protein [Flavobacterium branchiarum]MDN3675667.1 vitamin K epoxide reductase family protein [Flavobacterium branchiarum]